MIEDFCKLYADDSKTIKIIEDECRITAERYRFGNKMDQRMAYEASLKQMQDSSAIAKACDEINQVAAGSLGTPNFSQRYNFNNSDINTGTQPISQNESYQFLESKETSVTWSVLEPTEIIFPKIDPEMIPTLNVVGDSIKSFFNKLINNNMLQLICKWTNELHQIELEVDELRSFIGLLLLFGVLKKRDVEISEIWCSTSIHYVPQAQAAMPRDRFKQIIGKLSFYDPKLASVNLLNNKIFYKFQQVFDIFKLNNKDCITPESKLSIH